MGTHNFRSKFRQFFMGTHKFGRITHQINEPDKVTKSAFYFD